LASSVAGDQVLGGLPQLGIAQLGLHGLRPAGDLGLLAQRLSWRRSSPVRSVSRVRLVCIASSFRSAFSLRCGA